MRVIATTYSGSKYSFRKSGKKTFFSADNVPNANFRKIPEGEWEVNVAPWPPKIGAVLYIAAAHADKPIPGVKHTICTSRVTDVKIEK